MNEPIVVRPFEPRDRAAVRHICCETADSGQPMERFFSDREVFGDLLTRYYTDFEPQSTWVAEQGGNVVGYLTGTLDSARHLRVTAWRLLPVILVKALFRGTLWHAQTLTLFGANFSDWVRGGFRSYIPLRDFPAHVHINLLTGYRGQNVGPRLMESFIAHAQAAGVCGIHARVSADNAGGRRFFESQGFVALGTEARVRFGQDQKRVFSVVYGKRLERH